MQRKYSRVAAVHRALKFDARSPQRGDDIKAVQRAINQRIVNGKLPVTKLVVDGIAGRQTISVGRQVGRYLGLSMSVPGLGKGAQLILRNPKLRTPAQRKRAKTYKAPSRSTPSSQVVVSGNKVIGGTPRQRVVAAAIHAAWLYSTGRAKRFYAQTGRLTWDHAITGEKPQERSDCSQFVAGLHYSAGLADPNGGPYGGPTYTGTLGSAGTYIRRDQLQPGDNVLYGPAPHHHVEVWVGNGDGVTSYRELAARNHPDRDRTVGHGSPPVDYGDIDMIADPHFSRPKGL